MARVSSRNRAGQDQNNKSFELSYIACVVFWIPCNVLTQSAFKGVQLAKTGVKSFLSVQKTYLKTIVLSNFPLIIGTKSTESSESWIQLEPLEQKVHNLN